MMYSSETKGLGGAIALAFLGLVVVVGGVVYYGSRQLESLPPGALDWGTGAATTSPAVPVLDLPAVLPPGATSTATSTATTSVESEPVISDEIF